jgi:hypothetical protein
LGHNFGSRSRFSEIAALLGAIAIGLAIHSASAKEYNRLRCVTSWITCAYAVCPLVLLPYLYYMFAFEGPRVMIFFPKTTRPTF